MQNTKNQRIDQQRLMTYISEILNSLSQRSLLNEIYFEGGFVLNYIYNIPRYFSGDIDITIKNNQILQKIIFNFKNYYKDKNNNFIILNNKIISNDKNYLDFYFVNPDTFMWENREIIIDNQKFTLRVHSLQDILAEKISTVVLRNRFEFKDIIDINLIDKKLININKQKFANYLKNKLQYKLGSQNKIISNLQIEKYQTTYHKNPQFLQLSYTSELSKCQNIIDKYLLN